MNWLKRLRTIFILRRHPIPHKTWEAVINDATGFSGSSNISSVESGLFGNMSAVEKAHLRELATLFLYRKTINGVQGLTVSTEMAVTIAALACLPILKLGIEYYEGWVEIVLYPDAFNVDRKTIDNNGLVSQGTSTLSGESWSHGPVILSWKNISEDLNNRTSAGNVVIHEFAHKLDMLNGSANGMPPLHHDMDRKRWTEAFSSAFEHIQTQLSNGNYTEINSYAATDPAEFFAVTSEYFFTAPGILFKHYTSIYEQLSLYYRQDPLTSIHHKSNGVMSKKQM